MKQQQKLSLRYVYTHAQTRHNPAKLPHRAQSQNAFYLCFFHWILSFPKYCLPFKVVFHKGLSSIKGCHRTKAVFCQKSSSIKGCLPLKVVFHQRLSFTKGNLQPKTVFHRRSSSTEGCLPPTNNILVDFIFVRTVKIPNFSLLPCLEVAWCMMHDAWCMMHDA